MTNEEKYTQVFMQTFEIDENTAKNLKFQDGASTRVRRD